MLATLWIPLTESREELGGNPVLDRGKERKGGEINLFPGEDHRNSGDVGGWCT